MPALFVYNLPENRHIVQEKPVRVGSDKIYYVNLRRFERRGVAVYKSLEFVF